MVAVNLRKKLKREIIFASLLVISFSSCTSSRFVSKIVKPELSDSVHFTTVQKRNIEYPVALNFDGQLTLNNESNSFSGKFIFNNPNELYASFVSKSFGIEAFKVWFKHDTLIVLNKIEKSANQYVGNIPSIDYGFKFNSLQAIQILSACFASAVICDSGILFSNFRTSIIGNDSIKFFFDGNSYKLNKSKIQNQFYPDYCFYTDVFSRILSTNISNGTKAASIDIKYFYKLSSDIFPNRVIIEGGRSSGGFLLNLTYTSINKFEGKIPEIKFPSSYRSNLK